MPHDDDERQPEGKEKAMEESYKESQERCVLSVVEEDSDSIVSGSQMILA